MVPPRIVAGPGPAEKFASSAHARVNTPHLTPSPHTILALPLDHRADGTSPQGSKGGAWYIPGNSNLLFDIEILSKKGARGPSKEEL